jgi:hypothetical protein
MPPHSKAKYIALLEDPDVKRWYDNISRGSRVTADVYLRRLGSFCNIIKTEPKELASHSEQELYNLLLDRISQMEQEGKMGSYIESEIKSVKSWLSHMGKDIKKKIRIEGARDAPSLKDERVPTKEELKRIVLSSDKKTRVAAILVAHSGVRIQTIGNYKGDDGLRLEDFPELEVQFDGVEFKHKPTIVVVRKSLSKARHQYLSFLSEEGCEYIQDYLNERINQGEELTPKSPLVTPKLKMKPFIRANNVGDDIRAALRSAGFNWRPYVLRCYFDTMLMLAESKGLVLRDYRQFWMGHKGDIENRYTTNKCRLPEEVINDMRQAYERSQEFLQTSQSKETSEEKLAKALRKQLLLVAGFKQEEIDKIDLSALGDEEIQGILRRKLLGDTQAIDLQKQQPSSPKQRVVSVQETNSYLENGWEYVAKLTDNMVVIKNNFENN